MCVCVCKSESEREGEKKESVCESAGMSKRDCVRLCVCV